MVAPAAAPDADALFHSHLKLAYKIARRFGRMCPHLADDFESDALLALWTAAGTWNPERAKGKEFASHGAFKVHAAMIGVLRRDARRHTVQVWHRDDGDDTEPTDPVTLARDPHDDEAAFDLGDALAALPPAKAAAVRAYYFDEETQPEIAAAVGCSRETAGVRVRGGVGMLRALYAA